MFNDVSLPVGRLYIRIVENFYYFKFPFKAGEVEDFED